MTPRRMLLFAAAALAAGLLVPTGASAASLGRDGRGDRQPPATDYRDAALDGPSFMAVDAQGRTWAVWSYRRGAEVDIAVSRAVGRTWTAPELIGTAGADDLDPRLTFTVDGKPVVVWWQRAADGTGTVFAAARSSAGWSAPTAVATGTSPAAFTGPDGRLYVGYLDGAGKVKSRAMLVTGTTGFAGDSGSNGPDPLPTVVIRPPKIY